MPTFEFTSPTGETFTGEGASAEDAFKVAAERTRRSATRGAPAPEYEPSEATQAVKRGEYGPLVEAAGSSAGALASAAAPVASLLGQAVAPTAIAESMFAAEPDASKRRALEKQYREANPRGQREILKLFNEQQGKIAEERRGVEREAAERGETQKRRGDWMAQNADAIKSLRPEWQQQIQAAGSLPEAQEMFSRGMDERKKAGMTFAERYPTAVTGLEVAGMGLAARLPYKTATKRLTALEKTASDADEAFKAAWGAGAKKSKGREAEAALAENIMKETHKMWPVSIPKALGETTIPWIFAQAPNFLDITLGRLGGDPGDAEKVERAWNNIVSLGPLEQALLEGAAAVSLGTVMGMGGRDWKTQKARGRGILDTFEERRAAETAAANAKAAKTAAKAAPKQPTSLSDQLRNNDVLAPQADALGPDVTRAAMKRAQMFPE